MLVIAMGNLSKKNKTYATKSQKPSETGNKGKEKSARSASLMPSKAFFAQSGARLCADGVKRDVPAFCFGLLVRTHPLMLEDLLQGGPVRRSQAKAPFDELLTP